METLPSVAFNKIAAFYCDARVVGLSFTSHPLAYTGQDYAGQPIMLQRDTPAWLEWLTLSFVSKAFDALAKDFAKSAEDWQSEVANVS